MSDDNPLIAVVQALQLAAKDMPSLKKDSVNIHGGYKFVGVDDYYDGVAKVALKHGLSWKARVVDSEIVDTGKARALQTTYAYDLMHSPSGYVWNDFSRLVILHPLQGAQTAGSSLSYADKLFMRSTFDVVTGEGDADSSDNRAFEALSIQPIPVVKTAIPQVGSAITDGSFVSQLVTQKSIVQDHAKYDGPSPPATREEYERVQLDAEEAKTIYDLATGFIDLCKDVKALENYWHLNEPQYKRLKDLDTKLHKKMVGVFTAKKKELNGG